MGSDVGHWLDQDGVAFLELRRPPDNYFEVGTLNELADRLGALAADARCQVAVLCSEGRHFCAGARLTTDEPTDIRAVYEAAARIFDTTVPIVAATTGASIGGGLGLALAADFRVGAPSSRYAANFARLGFSQGFGMTVTLPRVVGVQRAAELLYTGRRIGGEEAAAIGLVDRLVADDDVRSAAHLLAREIAGSAPLAVVSMRRSLRGDLPQIVRAAIEREIVEQERLRVTRDFAEGVAAYAARRAPMFEGR
jgi:2-(1,2-epoxy-1,2-dihydrophenyl)acetyl-CoA isomerase